MKKYVVVICCLFSSLSVYAHQWNNGPGDLLQKTRSLKIFCQDDTSKTAQRIRIISSEGGTFGYEIYSGGKLLIRQANIPGMSGNKGFRRKVDAEKVARLVLEKLDKGIMPPTVEKTEMEKLKVEF
jgi:hypothetical protein